ncbi:hypothetical protein [Dyella silvatica]|uniref:hypothetical protein n=1 Tax=Dyella silvatica TaxID=2992128 RepID=UPI00224E5EDF|nr:hypothetical protein [Dyella silvatica]
MEQLNVVLHEDRVSGINPFGIRMEGPLQNQMPVEKRAPKFNQPGDLAHASRGFGCDQD